MDKISRNTLPDKVRFLTLLTVARADQFWFPKWKKPFSRDNPDTPPLANTPKQSSFLADERFPPSLSNHNSKNTLCLPSTNAYLICLTRTRDEMSPRDSAAARGPQQTVILKGINQENSAMTTHMKAVP